MSNNCFDLTAIYLRSCTGSLISNNGNVEVERITFGTDSLKKLSKVCSAGEVTFDCQNLHVDSISIKKNDDEVFTEGQVMFQKATNGYTVRFNPAGSKHFRAELGILIADEKGELAPYKLFIGGIEFNLQNARRTVTGDSIEYENVRAMIFPTGKYAVEEITE